jgi:hypothetical protein
MQVFLSVLIEPFNRTPIRDVEKALERKPLNLSL